MGRHFLLIVAALFLVAGVAPRTQAPTETVELDVAVSDNHDQPVTDLKAEEFQIQDDGKKADVKSVTRVSASGATRETGRTLVIILDDAGVPMAGTLAVQTIANLFASGTGPGDSLSVMSLHGTPDEQPNRQLALSRIASFQAGSKPYFEETQEDMLQLLTKISRQWQETQPGRRKAFVCVGSQGVCAILERESTAPRDRYPNWVSAMKEMARAHATAYAAIPARLDTTQGGYITDLSGGGTFSANSNFTPAVDTVLRNLSEYYLVSYEAPKSSKPLKKLRVTVTRKNMKVQVRTRR
jgi:hypothetical protein